MVIIKSLTGISIENIHKTFRKAFADYVESFDLSVEQLKYMIERRGCNLDLSFGAFYKNELVAFTLNGIGLWNGKLTAYDTGTGTIQEFRKQGIAKRIFAESLPVLRENNISQYLLEVIRTNTSAYDLYRKAGFKVTRELEYFISSKNSLKIKVKELHGNFQIKLVDKIDWALFKSFWEFEPSWQNSIDSINRKLDYFQCLGIYTNDSLLGYAFIEKHTGDIPQLAIHKDFRRKGLATLLISELISLSNTEKVQIINTETGVTSFVDFAKSINLQPGHGQYEMILDL